MNYTLDSKKAGTPMSARKKTKISSLAKTLKTKRKPDQPVTAGTGSESATEIKQGYYKRKQRSYLTTAIGSRQARTKNLGATMRSKPLTLKTHQVNQSF